MTATEASQDVPEMCWCESIDGQHDDRCDRAPMDLSKEQFVEAAEGGARAAIQTYLFLVNDEGFSHDEALDTVIEEAQESASCFAGIGSCGGGGCKH